DDVAVDGDLPTAGREQELRKLKQAFAGDDTSRRLEAIDLDRRDAKLLGGEHAVGRLQTEMPLRLAGRGRIARNNSLDGDAASAPVEHRRGDPEPARRGIVNDREAAAVEQDGRVRERGQADEAPSHVECERGRPEVAR